MKIGVPPMKIRLPPMKIGYPHENWGTALKMGVPLQENGGIPRPENGGIPLT